MKHITTWFVGETKFGEGVALDREYGRGTMAMPRSIAYFCPECGGVWGRIQVGTMMNLWFPIIRKCSAHGGGTMVPAKQEINCIEVPKLILRREIILWSKCPETNLKSF